MARIEKIEEDKDKTPVPAPWQNTPITNILTQQLTNTPEHPYQQAKDMMYSHPTTQNIGVPHKVPAMARKPEPTAQTVLG